MPPRLRIVPPQSCRRVSQLPQVRPVQSAFDDALRSLGERERRQVWHRGYDDRVDPGELGVDVLGLRPVVRPIALVELFLMAIGCPGRVSFRRIRLGSTPADRELGRQGDPQLRGPTRSTARRWPGWWRRSPGSDPGAGRGRRPGAYGSRVAPIPRHEE
jgi:hypothetical protein